MDEEPQVLPMGAGVFLMVFGLIIDGLQFFLTWAFVGIVLNPLILTPLAFCVFAGTAAICHFPMFEGKNRLSVILATASEFIPLLNGFVPGWFVYAVFITFAPRAVGIIERWGP